MNTFVYKTFIELPKCHVFFPSISIKDVWDVLYQPKVWCDQNFSTLRCNENSKKINHIKDVQNIYFFVIIY